MGLPASAPARPARTLRAWPVPASPAQRQPVPGLARLLHGNAACRCAAIPGQRRRWRPRPRVGAGTPSPIPATKARVAVPTARSTCRRAGACRRLPPRATRPAATWEVAASVPPPDAVRARTAGRARAANGPTAPAPASRPAGRRDGVPTKPRISSAPAPSDTRDPVSAGCCAPSWGSRPDACHRPPRTCGFRRARYLRSSGWNHPRGNPVQGRGRGQFAGAGARH